MEYISTQTRFNPMLCLETAVLLLMATGVVFVFSAGANLTTEYDLAKFYQFTTLKQLVFFPAAVLVMYGVSFVDYRKLSFRHAAYYKSLTPYLVAISLVLLVLVLIPGIGIEKNLSRRWLPLGFVNMSFQPSELAKWAVIFFLAAYLDRFVDSIHLFWKRFVPACVIPVAAVLLIVTQDFGTAAFIAFLTGLMLLIGGARIWQLLIPVAAAVPLLSAAVMSSATRRNRVIAYLGRFFPDRFPEAGEIAASYQANQSLAAIQAGGFWGRGLGLGVCKYGHLPEDTTDFIFAIICEELGVVGGAFVIGLFAAIIIFGMVIVARCEDRFGKLLAVGIVMTICIQAAVNVGVVTAVLPTKGIALPFVSAGGSGLLISAAAVGVLLNIAKQHGRVYAQ